MCAVELLVGRRRVVALRVGRRGIGQLLRYSSTVVARGVIAVGTCVCAYIARNNCIPKGDRYIHTYPRDRIICLARALRRSAMSNAELTRDAGT